MSTTAIVISLLLAALLLANLALLVATIRNRRSIERSIEASVAAIRAVRPSLDVRLDGADVERALLTHRRRQGRS